jgi:hypothetical protein
VTKLVLEVTAHTTQGLQRDLHKAGHQHCLVLDIDVGRVAAIGMDVIADLHYLVGK